MMSMNMNSIAILNKHAVDYCCISSGVSKSKAIDLLKNSDLNKKRWINISYSFSPHLKDKEKN